MMVAVVVHQEQIRPEAEYILATLLEAGGWPFEFCSTTAHPELSSTLWLHYGLSTEHAPDALIIPADDPTLWDETEPSLMNLGNLPLLYTGNAPTVPYLIQGSSVVLGFDVVQAAFWLLSRQEELERKDLDDIGRFPGSESWLRRHDLAETPVVNLYAALLDRALMAAAELRGMPVLRKGRWPHGRRYAVALSHDVDDAGTLGTRQGFRLLARSFTRPSPRAIVRGAYFALLGVTRSLSRGGDAYWYFDDYMELETGAGFRSSFYFVPEPDRVDRDPPYEVDTPRMHALMARLRAGGWEIGVHGSFDSYLRSSALRSQREKLAEISGGPVHGVRQHYLRLRVPESFRAQVEAGFVYDSSLGYHDAIGFRAGTAFPFRPFDPSVRQPLPLLELPLAVMDGSLFWELGLTPNEAEERTLVLLKTVRSTGGLAVLLWHQRVRHEKRYPGWWSVYRQIIEHLCDEAEAWVGTPGGIARWWLDREGVQLEAANLQGDLWRWRYRARRDVEGLTLRLTTETGSAPDVNVAGAELEGVSTAANGAQIRLGSLCAAQSFEVRLRC